MFTYLTVFSIILVISTLIWDKYVLKPRLQKKDTAPLFRTTLSTTLIVNKPEKSGDLDKWLASGKRNPNSFLVEDQSYYFKYFDTDGKLSERTVEIESVIDIGYKTYIYGYCRLRKDMRIFSVFNIFRNEIMDIKTGEIIDPRILARKQAA